MFGIIALLLITEKVAVSGPVACVPLAQLPGHPAGIVTA